ncbi:MAG: hypothetical protein Q8S21_04400 [Candidatus Paracaedibacteraceae bacterium]|nr:hypothetical protein [Candidatus Paracaedibacteraceae bacterium]
MCREVAAFGTYTYGIDCEGRFRKKSSGLWHDQWEEEHILDQQRRQNEPDRQQCMQQQRIQQYNEQQRPIEDQHILMQIIGEQLTDDQCREEQRLREINMFLNNAIVQNTEQPIQGVSLPDNESIDWPLIHWKRFFSCLCGE